MEANDAGHFLAQQRRAHRWSLQDVVIRMGNKGLSRQALCLIENGRMKIPKDRLKIIKVAYKLSTSEIDELVRYYTFEQLTPSTDDDRQFAKAILSVVEPMLPTSIYVIGGRELSINSAHLRQGAAEFLTNPVNTLTFIYPRALGANERTAWFSNSKHDTDHLRKSIEALSGRRLGKQIRFCPINVPPSSAPISLNLLSLCNPVTATTIVKSSTLNKAIGYVYVEGPTDRWVLLGRPQAEQIYTTIMSWLDTRN